MDIVAKDELNNSVFTIIAGPLFVDGRVTKDGLDSPTIYTAIDPHHSKVEVTFSYNTNVDKPVNASYNAYYAVLFSFGTVFTNFTLRPQPCRPGFVLRDGKCVCDETKTEILGQVKSVTDLVTNFIFARQ